MEEQNQWMTTEYPEVVFENTNVGRLKKQIWDASAEEIDRILTDYGIPADSELGKPGCYIQNTPRVRVIDKRRKNDVVLVPVGCTENHGIHANSGLDTFMVTQICEGVRRYTAKQGREVVLAFPPLNYGGHPYHHIGMPGTVIMPEEVVRDTVIYTLLGLWDDGFRKIILVNNHGHLWMLESAVQEFFKRFGLPALVTTVEWHRAVREFFYPTPRDNSMSTHFIHADEAETSVALLLFKDMIDMGVVVDAQGTNYCLGAHYDTSVDSFRRPQGWAQGQGHNAIERFGTPEAVVGYPSRGTAAKAKRPIAAILKYLTLMIDEILEAYPVGQVPPIEKFTFRSREELAACLKEPMSEGWKSVHELHKIGVF
jgi:creatinine amidohydrolase/Fe(II)-dependent formamide hydrolase-like protein